MDESSHLTVEQINLIPKYIKKWRKISFSTARIDREQAKKTINSVYEMLEYEYPKILFFDSPYAACNFVASQSKRQLNNMCGEAMITPSATLDLWFDTFKTNVVRKVQLQLGEFYEEFHSLRSADSGTWNWIDEQIGIDISQRFDNDAEEKLRGVFGGYYGGMTPREGKAGSYIHNGVCQLDYLISVFELTLGGKKWQNLNSLMPVGNELERWERFKSLVKLGNYVFLEEKTCIIYDRPTEISLVYALDGIRCLHAEGKPAITFADGYSLYSIHGCTLPKKYADVHPRNWKIEWFIEEQDKSLRKALIIGIGYVRLCSELAVTEIDCWKNFILINIDISHSIERYYLVRFSTTDARIELALELPCSYSSKYGSKSVQEAASSLFWEEVFYASEDLEIPF